MTESEFQSESPSGGIMFEKVLKRLCPCYFARADDGDLSECPIVPHKVSQTKQTSRSSQGNLCNLTNINSRTATSIRTDGQNNWKGTLNLVQPQPVYAFPLDLKKTVKRNQKNLLKPPLYWKKTMKTMHSEGPPVFQGSKHKNPHNSGKNFEKKVRSKSTPPKHCETVADTSSITSPSTVEIRWLKSQSVDNISWGTLGNGRPFFGEKKTQGDGPISTNQKSDKSEESYKDWNCLNCRLQSDISHGLIVFTAAYFNKKKICMLNIDRLENLSKKGRERNSYYTVVKLAVLPSEKYVKCSKILSNCSNPEVKQDFSFSVKDLSGKVLRLSVFDASLQKQHEAVGHALLPLEDIVCDQPKKYRIKLYRRTQPHVCPGNLALSLKYYPGEDKFTITVDKGKNLSLQRDKNVKLNTYVKVSLFAYGEKVKTKKSIVILDSRDPNYNSTFTFQVRKDQIDHLSVAIGIRLKSFVNELTIGRLNFGPFFFLDSQKLTPWGRVFLNGEFVSHWFRMYL